MLSNYSERTEPLTKSVERLTNFTQEETNTSVDWHQTGALG
jgi:hypothetical protein